MFKPENRKIFLTDDGSHSIIDNYTGETFHSVHGAITESTHVFIRNGLLACTQKDISLLEVGFGTGLNALLTLLETKKTGQNILYTALEPFPLDTDAIQVLNYSILLPGYPAGEFARLHQAPWEYKTMIEPNFYLVKHKITLQDFLPDTIYNLVYFDAFSPSVQPELWQKEIFEKLFSCMASSSILVTYAAKGQVRRNMQAAGFLTERLPGAPGKREMLRARKKPA